MDKEKQKKKRRNQPHPIILTLNLTILKLNDFFSRGMVPQRAHTSAKRGIPKDLSLSGLVILLTNQLSYHCYQFNGFLVIKFWRFYPTINEGSMSVTLGLLQIMRYKIIKENANKR